jgi:hypothetical protein
MTPPTVQFIPAAGGMQDIVSATSPGTIINTYQTHTNIDGDPLWDGAGLSNSFYFRMSTNEIRFYFSNNTDRNTAAALFSSWEIDAGGSIVWSGTPGLATNRLVFASLSAVPTSTLYTIRGTP